MCFCGWMVRVGAAVYFCWLPRKKKKQNVFYICAKEVCCMHTASEPKLKPIKIVKCSKIAKYFISSHFTKRHCALKLITRIRFTYREHSGV